MEIYKFVTYKKTIPLPTGESYLIKEHLLSNIKEIGVDLSHEVKIVIIHSLDTEENCKMKDKPVGVLCTAIRIKQGLIRIKPINCITVLLYLGEYVHIEKIDYNASVNFKGERKLIVNCYKEIRRCLHVQDNLISRISKIPNGFHSFEIDINSIGTKEDLEKTVFKLISVFDLGQLQVRKLIKENIIIFQLINLLDCLRTLRNNLSQYYKISKKKYISEDLTSNYKRDLYNLDFSNNREIQLYMARASLPQQYRNKINSMLTDGIGYKQKSYIRTVLQLPFSKIGLNNHSSEEIMGILNQKQYGMNEAKNRIRDYLMLLENGISNTDLPVLCLNGAPGTGKTSLAYAISKALDRPLVKVSLGGIDDVMSILGCSFAYSNSTPGMIIQAMMNSPVQNPVFLLDEVDKLKRGHGDPAAALLSVLDPTQNTDFVDSYVELPYDLSNVLFICTSNNKENISAPLRSRMEIIDIAPYSKAEKIGIIKSCSIPKLIKKYKMHNIKIDVSDINLEYIIRNYTSESGVRQLERCVETIFRKIAIQYNRTKNSSVSITKEMILEWLGEEKYGLKSEESKVYDLLGIAQCILPLKDGDIVPISIEARVYQGQNRIKVNGILNSKEAVESIEMILSILKVNYQFFGIPKDAIESIDIQINIPGYGVTYTQDCSASLFMTILSAITGQRIPSDVMILAGISLSSSILPVIDLQNSLNAIDKMSIKKLILSDRNAQQGNIIKNTVSSDVEVIFVSNVPQLMHESFANKDEITTKNDALDISNMS